MFGYTRVMPQVAQAGIVLACLALFLAACGSAPPPSRSPNVVLVVMESTRADHLSCMGYSRTTTPNLDRLCREAHLFTRAQSPSPWTRSSFASIISGTWPMAHGVYSEDGRHVLSERFLTIHEFLKQKGYATGAVYTIAHLAFGILQNIDTSHFLHTLPADRVFHQAVEWIEGHKHTPFFLLLHFIDPHSPYDRHIPFTFSSDPTPRRDLAGLFFLFNHSYQDFLQAEPGTQWAKKLSDKELAELTACYDSEIAYLDHYLGRLVDYLKYRGLWRNTVLIITSDHGEEFFDHGGYWHGTTLYQELLHVPLIIRVPGRGRGVWNQRVSTIDIFPTIMEITGGVPEENRQIQGLSLLPILNGREPVKRPFFAATQFRIPRTFSVLLDGYKLIYRPAPEKAEIYHIGRDPSERHDLARNKPLKERLLGLLNAELDRIQALPEQEAVQLDEETVEKLKTLGYM